jgi:tRNA modification GTPase
MFAPDDTIVAIATADGPSGIGVVRMSGPRAPEIARMLVDRREPLRPRQATFSRLAGDTHAQGPFDEVVVTWFAAPASYTGQDVVEISAHGSPVVLRAIVESAVAAGARLAEAGEFTLRAFLNGKRDLVQAEAVADLIAAATPLQARVAFDQLQGTLTRRIGDIDSRLLDLVVRLEASLDFPDEGYHFIDPCAIAESIRKTLGDLDTLLGDATRGRMIREGATVVIAGRTNVGKSSLFNALAGAERAIVTDVAGTTRDLVTERVDIEGLAVTLVDTAGARATLDVVEREGVRRGAEARRVADLVLLVLDASEPATAEDEELLAATADSPRLVVANKRDRTSAATSPDAASATAYAVSALTGEGISGLRKGIAQALAGETTRQESPALSNVRHIGLLTEARGCLADALESAENRVPEEFLLTDLQDARRCFDEIVGVRTSEDILREVFARFCIGK